MTLLSPTPSRRGRLRSLPWWALAALIGLVGVALIGAGLLVSGRSSSKSSASSPTASCTPHAAVGATATPATGTRVNVYNATDRGGLAAATATSLSNRGFVIGTVANDPRQETVTGAALVRHGAGATTQARWVAAQVGGARLVTVTRSGDTVDLVIGDGFEHLAGTKAAAAAFARTAPRTGC